MPVPYCQCQYASGDIFGLSVQQDWYRRQSRVIPDSLGAVNRSGIELARAQMQTAV
jgi:hypothetical protein